MAQETSFIQRTTQFVRRRWLPILIVVGVIVVFFALQGAGAQQSAAGTLQTASVERGNLVATIGATGAVRAEQSATLLWGTSGTVEAVSAQVGDEVTANQILANLELSSLPQNVILAQIDVEQAQDALTLNVAEAAKALAEAQNTLEDAERVLYNLQNPGRQVDIDQAHANMILALDQLDKARDDYEPYANKPENNLVRANYLLRLTQAQQEYDAAVRLYNSYVGTANPTDIAIAEGQLALAQGQLEIAQRNYETSLGGDNGGRPSTAEAQLAAAEAAFKLSFIEAPFAGTITDAYPNVGDLVSNGVTAFQIDDLSRMLVDVEVSEVDINRVQVGQTATVTFDAVLDRDYTGEVVGVAMAGNVESGVVNFRVTIELSDPDELVRPGMTAAVNVVVTELADVLIVPNRAVRVLDGQRVVYIQQNGQVVPVNVTLGASSETHSQILAGEIEEGDTVVLNPPTTTFDPSSPPRSGQFLMGN
jgi:HlyD family secretion protein